MSAPPPTLLLLACLLAASVLGAVIGACLCWLHLARRASRADRDDARAGAAERGVATPDDAALERRLHAQAQRIVELEAELYARDGRRVPRPRERSGARANVADAALPVLRQRVGADARPRAGANAPEAGSTGAGRGATVARLSAVRDHG